jgi:hypothetical protein
MLEALVESVCGPLRERILQSLRGAKKNRKLALMVRELIEEELFGRLELENRGMEEVNMLHSLFYLLASRAEQVFTSSVIHAILD